MNKTMHSFAFRPQQSGAALVVGLILLVAITLLALASMNTASLDLIMAGNEQYRNRAFTAAEAGIEQAIPNDANFNTGASGGITNTGTTATGETYTYKVVAAPPDASTIMAGTSVNLYVPQYFLISSTATTTRNTTATHTQEVVTAIFNPQTALTPPPGPGSSSSSSVDPANCLAATVSAC